MAIMKPKLARHFFAAFTILSLFTILFTSRLYGTSTNRLFRRRTELNQHVPVLGSANDFHGQLSYLTNLNTTKVAIPFGLDGAGPMTLYKRMDDEEWETLACVGEAILGFIDTPSAEAAVAYADGRGMQSWGNRIAAPYEDPAAVAAYGWVTTRDGAAVRDLRINAISDLLNYYGLSTNPSNWEARTTRHSNAWTDMSTNPPTIRQPSGGFYSLLVNARTTRSCIMWPAMFSPEYMIGRNHRDTIPPPLQRASDLYFLEYYRYWGGTQNYPGVVPTGGSPVPPPRYIIIRQIHEETIVEIFGEIKERQNDNSRRTGAKKFPGDEFIRTDDEFLVILTSPMGRSIAWFLSHHKHIFGAKTIGRMRLWATNSHENDYNLIFELIDPPPPSESADQDAGPDPPPPSRRLAARFSAADHEASNTTLLMSPRGTIRRLVNNRAVRSPRQRLRKRISGTTTTVSNQIWNSWMCTGQAMMDLMAASSDAAAATVADQIPLLTKWRGRTASPYHNPALLGTTGWTVELDYGNMMRFEEFSMGGAMEGSGISTELSDWMGIHVLHANTWIDGKGASQKPTKANYEVSCLKDKDEPVMIWSAMYSPWYTIKQNYDPRDFPAIPPLAFASDVIFLSYYEFWRVKMSYGNALGGGSQIPAPKIIFVNDIEEEDAVETVYPEIETRGGFTKPDDDESTPAPTWPGAIWTPESDYFKVMISTKQGRAIVNFLSQHKVEFGIKTVLSIVLYSCAEDGANYCLRFEIGDPPAGGASVSSLARRDSGFSFVGAAGHEPKSSGVVQADQSRSKTTPYALRRLSNLWSTPNPAIEGPRHRQSVRRTSALADLTDDQWKELICTGAVMYQLMAAADDAALEQVVEHSPLDQSKWHGKITSKWTNFDIKEIGDYGWEEVDTMSVQKKVIDDCEEFLSKLGLSTDRDNWSQRDMAHTESWVSEDGELQDQTGAMYDMAMNDDRNHAAILIPWQMSPTAMIKAHTLPDAVQPELPPLQRASDLQFLNYKDFWSTYMNKPQSSSGPVPSPAWIIIMDIVQEDAQELFYEFNDRENTPRRGTKNAPMWGDSEAWTPRSDNYNLFMAIPQGRGVAMLLFQHKALFGVKVVRSFRWVASSTDKNKSFFIYEIGDPDPGVDKRDHATLDGGVAKANSTPEDIGDMIEIKAKL